jgi:hypothetical protein
MTRTPSDRQTGHSFFQSTENGLQILARHLFGEQSINKRELSEENCKCLRVSNFDFHLWDGYQVQGN